MMGYRAIDPETLRGVAENHAILDDLAASAEPAVGPSTWAIDAFVLHTHPDLCERLSDLSVGVEGISTVGVFGVACILDGDLVIQAVARGTSSLWLRLPAEARSTLGPDEAWPAPEMGPDWIRLDAWQTVRPSAAGTAWLRALVGQTIGAAGPASRHDPDA